MKQNLKKYAIALSIILGAIVAYNISDLPANIALKSSNRVVFVKNSSFDVKSEYLNGMVVAKVKSKDINGSSYYDYSYLFGNSDEILSVIYLDKDGFILKSLPFTKTDLEIAESTNELLGRNSGYLTKNEAKRVKGINIIAKNVILGMD